MFLCPAGVGGPAAHNYVGVQCPCGMSWLPVEKKKGWSGLLLLPVPWLVIIRILMLFIKVI